MMIRTLLLLISCCIALNAGAVEPLRIVVRKEARTLEVLRDGKSFKTYSIALGFQPQGSKLHQGDGKTPEGRYYVRVKNRTSQFYLSLGLDYPNADDAQRGLQGGLINRAQYQAIVKAVNAGRAPPWNTKLGGEIFIHGGGTGSDWTWGCVALGNPDIKELFDMTSNGTPVDILP